MARMIPESTSGPSTRTLPAPQTARIDARAHRQVDVGLDGALPRRGWAKPGPKRYLSGSGDDSEGVPVASTSTEWDEDPASFGNQGQRLELIDAPSSTHA